MTKKQHAETQSIEVQKNAYKEFNVQTQERINWLQNITSGALIALAVGFVAVFISAVAIFHDAYTNKAATYLELSNEVKENNHKMDMLILVLQDSENQRSKNLPTTSETP